MIHLNSASMLITSSLIGKITNYTDAVTIGQFLANHYFFEENKDFFVYQTYKRFDVTEEEYNSEEPRSLCVRLKEHIRLEIQLAINQEIANDERNQKKKDEEDRAKRMRDLSTQHKEGTTAELMELLGVSKSEVRRLRASGELDVAIAKAKESRKEV